MKSVVRQCLRTLAFHLLVGIGLPLRAAARSEDLTPNNLSFEFQVAGTSTSPKSIDLTKRVSAASRLQAYRGLYRFAQAWS